MLPSGISTAAVTMKAPVSFVGDSGRIHVTIASSVPLFYDQGGFATPLADFLDTIQTDPGVDFATRLPHTDQAGFVDGSGAAFINWHYIITIKLEKEGQVRYLAPRTLQIPTTTLTVDLGKVTGGAPATPTTPNPGGYVFSVNGVSGAITLTKASVGLGNIDNTSDLQKPVSTAQADAIAAGKWLRPVDNVKTTLDDYLTPGEYEITKVGVANRPLAAGGGLKVTSVGGVIHHVWTTNEAIPRTFHRTRSTGGVWTGWGNGTWRSGALSSTDTLDTFIVPGSYEVPNPGTLGKPTGSVGKFDVHAIGNIISQEYLTLEAWQRKFSRQRVSGVWNTWQPLSYYQGILINGVDFDSLLLTALHSITFINHPNQPVAKPGSLEVGASGGDVTHKFTPSGDNPDEWTRRKVQNTGLWTAWQIRAFSNSSTPGGTLTTANDPVRAPLGTWAPALAPVDQHLIINSYNHDRTVGFNGNHGGGDLLETRDNGATWTLLKDFGPDPFLWVQQLENGELLVCAKIDPNPRDLWLSAGYGTGTVTWSKVLTASAPYVTFASSWGVSVHKNIIVVAEYGPKLPTWNGYTVPAGENARYVYLSVDSGKTWSTVFDLNTYLAAQGRATPTGNHIHGVAWDPYWDRVWVTFGDDTNGTVFSDDLGVTWETAHYGTATNSPYQNVGIIAMPKAILFGTDNAPNGVQRISRSEGKHAGAYPIEQAYTVPGDNGTARTHLCHAIHRIEREGGDGPVLFGFSSETTDAPSFIVGTYDGFNFTLLWMDSVSHTAGMGLRTIAGPNLAGQLVVSANDGRTAGKWSRWTGPAPLY